MFLVCLVLTLLCYQPVSSEALRNVSPLSEIQRWIKQLVMDAEKVGLDEHPFFLYRETDGLSNLYYPYLNDEGEKEVQYEVSGNVSELTDIQRWSEQEVTDADKLVMNANNSISYFFAVCNEKSGNCEIDFSRNEKQLECGKTPDTNEDGNKVFLFGRVEGLDILKTTIGIGKVGNPLECTIVHGIQPLSDFVKTHPELMKFRDITWRLKQFMFISKWMQSTITIHSVFAKPTISIIEYKDYANCNLCLTEREWIFMAIICVVLALCITNILLPRLTRERIRIHNPVSETLKLPH